MRAADLLARRLYLAGCRHAFGMPGGEVLTLVDALEAAGIRFTLAKHENAAGFMAEGTFHATGAPGILVATVGPGAANGVNAVANAHQDRVPLIVLTGAIDPDEALTYTHQLMDHRALFAPITKAGFTLTARGAEVIADKALHIAMLDRQGPVHIDVPMAVADAEVAVPMRSRHRVPSPVAPAHGTDLEEVRGWLHDAERPLIIAGLDVLAHDAVDALRWLAEARQIPVITTYKAKGVLPEDHPLALGGAGLSPRADAILLPLVKAADVILAVGYDPIEMRIGWRDPWDPATQKVVELTAVPNTHYMHQATRVFVGDVGAGLDALARKLPPLAEPRPWALGCGATTRAALRRAFSAPDGWGPAAIVQVARECLPRHTVATVDSGAHRILLSQAWECLEPRGLLQSSALCTMGCALPLAIGRKLAEPGRPVVAFTGDAGLLMVLGELATLAELELPVIVVVFVDASLALIEVKQRQRQLPNIGVDFSWHDYARMAEALGGVGERVSDAGHLRRALQAAVGRKDRFTLIAAEFDRRAYDGAI
jgi:acetolactate synthase-1/2/3 large subunit